MLGLLRRLSRLRGPAGVLVVALGFGLFTGLVAAHLVLAAWTYRDAARRDLREPGRWALAVLVGGVFTFVPYVLLQRATDWSSESRGAGAVRRIAGRGRRAVAAETEGGPETTDAADGAGGADGTGGADGARAEVPVATPDGGGGRSLAVTTAKYGWKAARLSGRGARWAAGRAIREFGD